MSDNFLPPESPPTTAPRLSAPEAAAHAPDVPAPEIATVPVSEGRAVETVLRFSGVYLLTTGPQGLTAVPGLQLTLDGTGLTVAKNDDEVVWTAPWGEVAELATPEPSKLPDGADGLVVVVTTREKRSHRFVARRFIVVPRATPRSQSAPVVVGAIVIAAAVVAALLLAAGHVVHL